MFISGDHSASNLGYLPQGPVWGGISPPPDGEAITRRLKTHHKESLAIKGEMATSDSEEDENEDDTTKMNRELLDDANAHYSPEPEQLKATGVASSPISSNDTAESQALKTSLSDKTTTALADSTAVSPPSDKTVAEGLKRSVNKHNNSNDTELRRAHICEGASVRLFKSKNNF